MDIMGDRITQEQIDLMVELYNQGLNYKEISEHEGVNVSRPSVTKHLAKLGIVKVKPMNSISLWSVKHLRPYIVDKNIAEELTTGSNKPIKLKCPYCEVSKEMKVYKFAERGMSCNCTVGISYGNLAFDCYQKHLKLNFKSEQVLEGLENRRVDFANYNTFQIVEVHGLQHYKDTQGIWTNVHEGAIEQDKSKREFANNPNNPYSLIELDMRKSTWEQFKQAIENEPTLPNMNKEDEIAILEMLEKSKRYPVKEIKRLYLEEYKSTIEIGKIINISNVQVRSILIKNGVSMRNSQKMVRLKETGEVFKSIREAGILLNIPYQSISDNVRGRTKSCSKHPITGDRLHFEFVNQSEQYAVNLDTDLSLFE